MLSRINGTYPMPNASFGADGAVSRPAFARQIAAAVPLAVTVAEYFPKVPVSVGNELFWYIFDGEPVAENGVINLDDAVPGFGLTLKHPDPNFKLTR